METRASFLFVCLQVIDERAKREAWRVMTTMMQIRRKNEFGFGGLKVDALDVTVDIIYCILYIIDVIIL